VPRTLEAFRTLDALATLEGSILPVTLGAELPFSPAGSSPRRLRLARQRSFSDGTVELVYAAI
jgi:hypothetical protein